MDKINTPSRNRETRRSKLANGERIVQGNLKPTPPKGMWPYRRIAILWDKAGGQSGRRAIKPFQEGRGASSGSRRKKLRADRSTKQKIPSSASAMPRRPNDHPGVKDYQRKTPGTGRGAGKQSLPRR